MDNQTLNYVVFFILLFLIIYAGCVDRTILDKLLGIKEKFSDKGFDNIKENKEGVYVNRNKYDELEGTHYKLNGPLVPRLLKEPRGSWKKLYREKYLKGSVDYGDSFGGVVTRNYLDNMNYFVN